MLYISDLDGTLLNSKCQLSTFTRNKLTELINDGVLFTIATARGIYSIKEILGDLPLNLPVICNNGSYIRNFQTREALYQSAFQPNIVNAILAMVETAEMDAFITSFKPNESGVGGTDCLYHNLILNEGMQWFLHDRIRSKDPRIKSNVHYSASLNNQITCLTIIDTLRSVQDLKEKIDDKFSQFAQTNIMQNPYQKGFYWLTVQDIKTTKGNAVKWLANYLNKPLSQVTVFGDEVNDISMFEIAGRAIAMDDAKEILKQKASLIIGNHNDDAVPKFIEKSYK